MMKHILILGGTLYTLFALNVALAVFLSTWRWAGPGMFLLTLLLATALGYAGYIGWLAWRKHGELQLARMTPKQQEEFYDPSWAQGVHAYTPYAFSITDTPQPSPMPLFSSNRPPRSYSGSGMSAADQRAYDEEMQDYEDAKEFYDLTHIGPEPF